MSKFVCIDCFDFVERCGHSEKENMYPFESYVGTDKENLEPTSERLEEIFSFQPDKSLLTKKEYDAVIDHVDQALAEADNILY